MPLPADDHALLRERAEELLLDALRLALSEHTTTPTSRALAFDALRRAVQAHNDVDSLFRLVLTSPVIRPPDVLEVPVDEELDARVAAALADDDAQPKTKARR